MNIHLVALYACSGDCSSLKQALSGAGDVYASVINAGAGSTKFEEAVAALEADGQPFAQVLAERDHPGVQFDQSVWVGFSAGCFGIKVGLRKAMPSAVVTLNGVHGASAEWIGLAKASIGGAPLWVNTTTQIVPPYVSTTATADSLAQAVGMQWSEGGQVGSVPATRIGQVGAFVQAQVCPSAGRCDDAAAHMYQRQTLGAGVLRDRVAPYLTSGVAPPASYGAGGTASADTFGKAVAAALGVAFGLVVASKLGRRFRANALPEEGTYGAISTFMWFTRTHKGFVPSNYWAYEYDRMIGRMYPMWARKLRRLLKEYFELYVEYEAVAPMFHRPQRAPGPDDDAQLSYLWVRYERLRSIESELEMLVLRLRRRLERDGVPWYWEWHMDPSVRARFHAKMPEVDARARMLHNRRGSSGDW